MKRKILASSLAVALFSLVTSPPTLSYLTDDDAVTNNFTAGNITVETRAETSNCTAIETDETCTEAVSVANTGISPAYVKVEVWVPSEILSLDLTTLEPLYYSLSLVESSDFSAATPTSETKDSVDYSVYRFTRSEILPSGSQTGVITLNLTNRQVASTTSGNVNEEECTESGETCTATNQSTASLVNAGIEVYTKAIQAQGFESASEAFANY